MTAEEQKIEDERINKIMAECQRVQILKEVKWRRMSADDLLFEIHRLLNEDDDLMDQDNLFDAQTATMILLQKRCLVDREGNRIEKMRREFVRVTTKKKAQDKCPWAARIVFVDGGCMCFESIHDYATWMKQC